MDFQSLGAIAGILGIIAAFLRYLDKFDDHLRNQTDLLWKQLELQSELMDRPEVMNGFLAKSGRMLTHAKAKVER